MIQKNVPLNRLCTYKTGGNAEFYCETQTEDELKNALKYAGESGLEITIIGGGYNLLIADGGVRGLVVNTSALNRFITENGVNVYAGAGVEIDSLIEWACGNGLGGLEEMSGIPGCVGGAVKMNAGAFGTEIKDVALSIDMMDTEGHKYSVVAKDAGFGYRKSENLKGIVLGANFGLKHTDSGELKAKRAEILAKRDEKQPLDYPSCGSVFKRPEGNYAGTLIEQCGLKGFRIGGAEVSVKHANFILNKGGATSKDILDLMKHVQDTVKSKTGITLEMEVRLVGF